MQQRCCSPLFPKKGKYMSIVAEALAKLTARIQKIEFEDDFDLCYYIEMASRMKALGYSDYFDRIPEICQKDIYRGRLDEIIRNNARRGMFDLDERDGSEAACIIVEAQDWYCFRQFTKNSGLYDKNTGPYMDQWAEETSLKMFNAETASFLRDWLDTYPIPEELRLPVVDSPVTEWEYDIMGKIASLLMP